ncbi:hypothetical protein COO60DRAFT_997109 [Scenedesmus sp. NREL 46B-D3]|nr:hypothetical protein COO60DRAFT_997109 [Scenedesmus sp. NREL 46B-D3]
MCYALRWSTVLCLLCWCAAPNNCFQSESVRPQVCGVVPSAEHQGPQFSLGARGITFHQHRAVTTKIVYVFAQTISW